MAVPLIPAEAGGLSLRQAWATKEDLIMIKQNYTESEQCVSPGPSLPLHVPPATAPLTKAFLTPNFPGMGALGEGGKAVKGEEKEGLSRVCCLTVKQSLAHTESCPPSPLGVSWRCDLSPQG